MFSGLIKSNTKIKHIKWDQGEFRLTVGIPHDWNVPLEIGQSIALNGVCLSVEHFSDHDVTFYVMRQTIERSNFGEVNVGDELNMEAPLQMSDYLNGHFVLGHVDGTVKRLQITPRGNSYQIEFEKPAWLAKFLYDRTSICINGVSLTVSNVWEDRFAVNVIPITQEKTNLLGWEHPYNIEIDHFSKMIEKLFELRN